MVQKRKYFSKINPGLFVFPIILVIIFSSCYSLRINEIDISNNLKENRKDKLKIIHISDIHIKDFNDKENIEELIKTINDLHGDIIVYTGDYGSLVEMKQGYEIFPKLKCRYKKYAVLGNHDYGDQEHAADNWKSDEDKKEMESQLKALYNRWGVELLLNESDTLNYNNHFVAVIGLKVFDPHHGFFDSNLDTAISNVNSIENKILLIHNPNFWSEKVTGKYDIKLSLAGHTHGGQFGIGFGNYKISPAKLMYPQWRGLYEKNNESLIVNTGIGIYGFPYRIGMDPEIIVIMLPLI